MRGRAHVSSWPWGRRSPRSRLSTARSSSRSGHMLPAGYRLRLGPFLTEAKSTRLKQVVTKDLMPTIALQMKEVLDDMQAASLMYRWIHRALWLWISTRTTPCQRKWSLEVKERLRLFRSVIRFQMFHLLSRRTIISMVGNNNQPVLRHPHLLWHRILRIRRSRSNVILPKPSRNNWPHSVLALTWRPKHWLVTSQKIWPNTFLLPQQASNKASFEVQGVHSSYQCLSSLSHKARTKPITEASSGTRRTTPIPRWGPMEVKGTLMWIFFRKASRWLQGTPLLSTLWMGNQIIQWWRQSSTRIQSHTTTAQRRQVLSSKWNKAVKSSSKFKNTPKPNQLPHIALWPRKLSATCPSLRSSWEN